MERHSVIEKNGEDSKNKEFKRKNSIGVVAARLFDKKGYLETSLKDIATEVKLSKGCIYHYFTSKHEILYFILDAYMDHLLGGLEEELENIADNSSKIKHIMFRHLMLYNNKVPEARAILVDANNLPEEYYKAIAFKQKKYAQLLTDALSGFFDGRMPVEKSRAISYILFGMSNSIMHWHNPEGPIKLEELSEICYDLFMNGITHYKNNI